MYIEILGWALYVGRNLITPETKSRFIPEFVGTYTDIEIKIRDYHFCLAKWRNPCDSNREASEDETYIKDNECY